MVQIKKLLSERKEAYMNCDFAFDTDNLSVKQVADIILSDSSIVKLLEKGNTMRLRKIKISTILCFFFYMRMQR